MATPKRDNSKGQRKVAVAKKADPGSRGRKTTVLKGPGSNARVTPKLVESGVTSPAKLVAALIAKVGSKKASEMIAKSKPTSNVKTVSNKTPKTEPTDIRVAADKLLQARKRKYPNSTLPKNKDTTKKGK